MSEDPCKRKYERLDCNIPASVDFEGVPFPGKIANLSLADGDIHLCVRLEGGSPGVGVGGKCQLQLVNKEDPFEYEAKVIRVGAAEIVLSVLAMHLQL